jgi:hypothetical protein
MESDMTTENNFRKVGNTWMVLASEKQEDGATVPVQLKSGSTKPVKLGRIVGYLYTIEGDRQGGGTERSRRWQYQDADERDDYRN